MSLLSEAYNGNTATLPSAHRCLLTHFFEDIWHVWCQGVQLHGLNLSHRHEDGELAAWSALRGPQAWATKAVDSS